MNNSTTVLFDVRNCARSSLQTPLSIRNQRHRPKENRIPTVTARPVYVYVLDRSLVPLRRTKNTAGTSGTRVLYIKN